MLCLFIEIAVFYQEKSFAIYIVWTTYW